MKKKIFMKSAGRRGYSPLARVFTLAVMLLTLAAGGAWAQDSFTISFKTTGNSSDGSSAQTTIDGIIASGADYVSEVSATKVYNAKSGYGIKLGSSSATGSLTLTLANAVENVTSIVVNARQYGDGTSERTLKIQDKSYTTTDEFADYTYTYETPATVSTITLGTVTKRAYIKSVTVNYTASQGGSPEAMSTTVKYALSPGNSFNSGQTVEVKNGEDVVATITYGGTGGNVFKPATSSSQVSGYTAYTSGNGTNGNNAKGTFYTIAPKFDGTITVAVFLSADKKFYVEEDGTALSDYNGITKESAYYGTFSFDVTKDKPYKFYCAGGKLGFYGFEYTYGGGSEPEQQGGEQTTLTVKELTAADASTWGSDYFKNLSKTDMPGFQAVPQAAAKAWTEVPSGDVVLIYDYDSAEGEWLTCAFSNGSFFDFQSRDFSRKDIYDNISYGLSFYYTTGIQQQTEPASGIVKLAEGTLDAAKWTARAGETGEFTALPLEGVAEGTKVTLQYSGTKRVKSVTAVEKTAAPTAAEGHALSASAVGEVVGTDGMAYAVADKDNLPTGVTAAGMVAYKNGSNGLVIALTDEASTMDWDTAKGASGAAAHTPAVTGQAWKLPSQAEWKQMFSANGGNEGSSTGLNTALTNAGGTTLNITYWSSTEDSYALAFYGWFSGGSAGFYEVGKANPYSVRACLAF